MKRILVSLVVLIGGVVGLMALFPEKVAELSRNSERSKSGLTYKTVVVADETWHYLEGGEKDAKVVLLLHGFGASKDVWTQFLRPLANDYRVLLPTCRVLVSPHDTQIGTIRYRPSGTG